MHIARNEDVLRHHGTIQLHRCRCGQRKVVGTACTVPVLAKVPLTVRLTPPSKPPVWTLSAALSVRPPVTVTAAVRPNPKLPLLIKALLRVSARGVSQPEGAAIAGESIAVGSRTPVPLHADSLPQNKSVISEVIHYFRESGDPESNCRGDCPWLPPFSRRIRGAMIPDPSWGGPGDRSRAVGVGLSGSNQDQSSSC
jgi:hypothetical protein